MRVTASNTGYACDSSDTREKGGTGLGLAITKAIIDEHGGSIDFFSEEDVGSEFFFELPEWRDGAIRILHKTS